MEYMLVENEHTIIDTYKKEQKETYPFKGRVLPQQHIHPKAHDYFKRKCLDSSHFFLNGVPTFGDEQPDNEEP